MKICMITDAWWSIWGGGQEHIDQVSKILRQKYHFKVDIVAPTLVNKTFNFKKFSDRIWFLLWTVKFYLTSNYDLYMSHSFSATLFLPLAKLKNRKISITLHGMGKEMIGAGLLNKLGVLKLVMRLVLDFWPYDYKFSATAYKNFAVVGNGVNINDFNKVKVTKKPKKFRIFWIGRKYDPIKGVKYLEEAVKGLAVDLDLAENVYGEQKIKRFKMANLFVLPSLSEGLPLVLLEAMAAKLPVVTTDVGDCRRLVEDAKCGLVVPPGDTNALREAIIKIKNSKTDYGENGYKFVKNNYSWDKVANAYQTVLTSNRNNNLKS